MPFGTRKDLIRASKHLVLPFLVANVIYIVVLWALALGYSASWLRIDPADAGPWEYQVEKGEMTVSFMNQARPEEATVKYAWAESSVEMTLLDGVEGKAKVRDVKLAKPRPFAPTIIMRMMGAIPGATIEYRVSDISLKEDIVIFRPEAVFTADEVVYRYALKLDKAMPVEDANGNPTNQFYNPANGRYAFHIPKLVMIDDEGIRSTDIAWSIRPTAPEDAWFDKSRPAANQWMLSIFPSRRWLQDSERAYPVRIDPTITHDSEADFTAEGSTLDNVEYGAQTGETDEGLHMTTNDYYTDSATVLLLAMDGTADSTAFVDSSDFAHTVTSTGGALHSTSKSIFGPTSGYFDGSDDFLSVPDSNDFTFGAGNFTVDGWIYPETLSGTGQVFNQWITGTEYAPWAIYRNGSALEFYASSNGTSWDIADGLSCGTLDSSRWQHFAVTRDGNTFACFLDGQAQGVTESSLSLYNSTGSVLVGKRDGGTPEYYQGWLDHLRLSKGTARWTTDFSTPAPVVEGTYVSPIIDSGGAETEWDNITWSEENVSTGDAETPATTTGLVAEWEFNETSGTTAAVTSGSCGTSCNGTLISFTDTSGQDTTVGSGWTNDNQRWGGGALVFDGNDDYVDAGTNSALKPTSALSLEAWIRADVLQSPYTYIAGVGRDSAASGYSLFVRSDGRVSFEINTDDVADGAEVAVTSSVGSVTAGDWHYLVATYDATDGAKLYINGQSVGSAAADGDVYYRSGQGTNFKIGEMSYDDGGANHYFQYDGVIDVLRLYNSVLTPAQVVASYQPGEIEVRTRTGDTENPEDGTWEEWQPMTGSETQFLPMDSDEANWSWTTPASDYGAPVEKADESFVKVEGTGTMKIQTGRAQNDAYVVGLWHLDESSGSGAYLKDSSGNSYHGTPTGTAYSHDARSVGSRHFDGSSDYVDIGDQSGLKLTSAVTLDAWVKPTNTDDWMGIITKRSLADTDTSYFLQTIASTNEYQFAVRVGGTNYDVKAGPVTFGKWTHVAATYDGETIYMYIDGEQVASNTLPSGTIENTTIPVVIGGRADGSSPWSGRSDSWHGWIDEARISNVARSADWVSEQFRMGRDHRLERTVSAKDMTDAGKIPFWIAADRPGTYLETVIGESSYANGQTDSDTVYLWHLDDIAIDNGVALKDSVDSSGNGSTAGGAYSTSGKVGTALGLDGNDDFATFPHKASIDYDDYTVSLWFRHDGDGYGSPVFWTLINKNSTGSGFQDPFHISVNSTSKNLQARIGNGTDQTASLDSGIAVDDGIWHHVALTRNGTSVSLYLDGMRQGSATIDAGTTANTDDVSIGSWPIYNNQYNGAIDEVRIDKTARTASEIRQQYEYGRRSHSVTVDFAAKLDSDNLISGSSDHSFTVDGSIFGLYPKAAHLNNDDVIIVRENVDGTEYLAQARVSTVSQTTGAVTIPAWIAGSTFPTSGFTAAAQVMKWQRSYWDISDVMTGSGASDPANQKNAITKVGLRLSEANLGRTVYLDDFRYVSSYLDGGSGTVESSPGQYFQYEIIYTGGGYSGGGGGGTAGGSGETTGGDGGGDPPAPEVDDIEIGYTETIVVGVDHSPASPTVYQPVTLEASASVPSGITRLELYLDGENPADLIHACDYSPAETPVDCDYPYGLMDRGSHTVKAIAYSAFDNASTAETFGVAGITRSNHMTITRSTVDIDTDFTLEFTLDESSTGTLTVTFPASFGMISAATDAASSDCFSNFAFDDALHQLTATKTACLGAVTFGGAVIHTPVSSGSYQVTWTNDNGEGTLFITDDDQVNVSGNVDPTLTFDIDIGDESTDDTTQPYAVDFGQLDFATPESSNNSTYNSIWLDFETNATEGGVITVRSANAAMVSSSTSDQWASGTASLAANSERYGICVDTTIVGTPRSGHPGGTTWQAIAPFDTSCTAGATMAVGALQTSDQTLMTAAGPLDAGRVQVRVGMSVASDTPAHPDYSDILTFIATATY